MCYVCVNKIPGIHLFFTLSDMILHAQKPFNFDTANFYHMLLNEKCTEYYGR